MNRLTLDDDKLTAITTMSEGIPGAAIALAELAKQTPAIDPHAGLGPLHYLFFLDDLHVYGPRIWIFFKDVCKTDYITMIAVLRAWQLGFLSRESLVTAIDTARSPFPVKLDLDDLLAKVKDQVPDFGVIKV